MVSRLKGGKAFITLDDGALPLAPRVVADNASAVACLSEKGRLLVFGMDELKTLSNGGRGVTLMELEEKEKLLAVQPITQKGVIVTGTWAAPSRARCRCRRPAWQPHFGKRARKGKPLVAKVKVQDLAMRQRANPAVASYARKRKKDRREPVLFHFKRQLLTCLRLS